jgi:flagellar basal body-associated protein FliL
MSETQEKRLFGLVLILVVVVALLAGVAIYSSYMKNWTEDDLSRRHWNRLDGP